MNKYLNKIKFFSNKAIFKEITDSNSGAILRKVIDNDNTYFLKIVNKHDIDINKIKKIIEIYKNNHIKTVNLLTYGYIDNKIYLIYDFINGYALNKVYDEYAIKDYYNMGFEIGSKYRKINVKDTNNIFITNYSLKNLVKKSVYDFKKLYNNDLSYLKNIIKENEIAKLISKINELTDIFDDIPKVYVHGDIHPKNIMINNNYLYIIDIESFGIDYFIMNIRWSILAAFKNKKNNSFFNGFISGFYDNKIPFSFNKQIIFIFILNFIDHVIEFSQNKNKKFIINYVSKITIILNTLDLSGKEYILDPSKTLD